MTTALTVGPAFGCTGALSVDLNFERGSESLDGAAQATIESTVRKARGNAGAESLRVAFAVHSRGRELGSTAELDRLNKRRAVVLRDRLASLGIDPSGITAVRGADVDIPGQASAGGVAELEIAFGCQ